MYHGSMLIQIKKSLMYYCILMITVNQSFHQKLEVLQNKCK